MSVIVVIIALLLQPPPTYVAFGDSITVGNLASTPELGWARQTAAPWTLDNRAEGGTVVADQVERIRAYQGDAPVALWLVCANDLRRGTNAETFRATVQEGVDLLRGKGLDVWVNRSCLPFPEEDTTAYDGVLSSITGAHLVDVTPGFLPSFFADGVHPNDAGHAAIAGAYLGAMHRRVYLPMMVEGEGA